MTRATVRAVAALLALLALTAVATSAASAATLSGTVRSQAPDEEPQPLPLPAAQVQMLDPVSGRPVATATADATGAYAVTVPDGTYDVEVSAATWRTAMRREVAVLRGAALDVTLVPFGHVHLSGIVRDSGGTPVERMSVSTYGTWTQSAADGSFSVAAPGGATPLQVYGLTSPDDQSQYVQFLSDELQLDDDRAFELALPAWAAVDVHAHGPRAEPLDFAEVLLPQMTSTGSVAPGVPGTFSTWSSGVTGADGRARLWALGGSVPSSADAAGRVLPASDYAVTEFPVPAIDPRGVVVDVEAAPVSGRHRIAGVILDEDGPLAGVHLRATGASQTGADGRFVIGGVEHPTQHIYASWAPGPDDPAGVAKPWWYLWGELQMGQNRSVALRLPAYATLTVRVLGAGGRPLPGLDVSLPSLEMTTDLGGDLPGTTLTSWSYDLSTDAAGEARVPVFAGSAPAGGTSDGVVHLPDGTRQPFTVGSVPRDTTIVVNVAGADATPPQIDCAAPPSGWHGANVAVPCTASDAESGLADPADAAFELETTVPVGVEDARALTGTRQVCDAAGNCAAAGPAGPVAVDRAAPAIAFSLAPDPLARGDWWTVSRIAVQVTATDANVASIACSVDGVARSFAQTRTATTISGTFYVNQEARHTAGCTALDAFGRVGTGTRPVNIDLRAPLAPVASADRPAEDPVYGWHRDSVTVSFADAGDRPLADGSPGSGVDPLSLPAAQTFSASGTHVAAGSATDVAGRVSAVARLTVKVDADPPTSTLTCPSAPVARGASAVARWQDADAHSGLPAPATGSLPLDTSAVGWFPAERLTRDRVGHTVAAGCSYRVVHPFVLRGNLQAPPALNPIAPGETTRTVHFSIGGDLGLGIFGRSIPRVREIACADGAPVGRWNWATLAGPFAWDPATGRYGIPWQVAADVAPGACAAFAISLDDRVTHEVLFARG